MSLKLKFGTDGLKIYPQISKIDDVDKLRSMMEAVEIAKDIREIEELLS